MDLAPFKGLIKKTCGLSFDDIRSGSLEAGIKRRMSIKGIGSGDEYLDMLKADMEEFHCLISLLTVNETYFFREPAHFSIMNGKVLPDMLARAGGAEKIKILSAGCSTGEEPYTIVMAAMDKFGRGIGDFISVFGVDIDDKALDKARKGVFSSNSFRGGDDGLKEKYFESLGPGRYRIKDFVRDRVTFRKLNLLDDSYSDELEGLDIIFYRNVSIYFEAEIQEKIFSILAGLLREKGVMFVSSTETIFHNSGLLSLAELEGLYFFRKEAAAQPVRNAHRTHAWKRQKPAHSALLSGKPRVTAGAEHRTRIGAGKRPPVQQAVAAAEDGEKDGELFEAAVSAAKEKKYGQALKHLERLLLLDPSHAGACILKAGVLMNMKRLEDAEEACLRGLELDKWHAEAYLLLGLISRNRGDDKAALKRFKEALYISPSIWPAHYYMAEIYRSEGAAEKACREYEIVARLIGNGSGEHGFAFFSLSSGEKEIERLCRHNIAGLRSRHGI